ncbi:hypothetical protein D3C73_1561810 [compost metagenome]
MLEKDHELADSFIQSFHDTVQDLCGKPCVTKERVAEAASHLLQACLILHDHVTMEEQLVLPMADEVLTELDYFFS